MTKTLTKPLGQSRTDGGLMRRSIPQAVRSVALENGAPGVRLKIIRYNVVDDYGSVWLPGCLIDGLNERLPQMAWSHDRSVIIGRATPGFTDDDDGMLVNFRYANLDKVPAAATAHSLVEDEIIDECSVGFRWGYEFRTPDSADLERWPCATEIITKAFVSEVSLVMEGAVPGAVVVASRSTPLLRVQTVAKREAGLISEDDASRILAGMADAIGSGVPRTDALLAALQDVKSVATLGDEDENTPDPDPVSEPEDAEPDPDAATDPAELDPQAGPDLADPDNPDEPTEDEIAQAEAARLAEEAGAAEAAAIAEAELDALIGDADAALAGLDL